jgi:hypothetical protein
LELLVIGWEFGGRRNATEIGLANLQDLPPQNEMNLHGSNTLMEIT